VVEDLADDFGVDDENENFHSCPTTEAAQRVDLVEAVEELSPPFAQSPFESRIEGHVKRMSFGGFKVLVDV
jgi:hypothetical protein